MQKFPLRFATGAIILGLGLSGCGPPPGPPVTGERAALRECPHTWEFPEEEMRGEQQALEDLTRGNVHVPEYNDCQRFIVGNANSPGYDSLYAIFAVQLDSLEYRAAQYGREGITAAIIYAEGLYPRLGIQPGFNCLVMRGDPQSEEWEAAMKPVGSLAECEGPVPMPAGPPLDVRANVVEGISGDDYPPVARWGFDETTLRLHYMIVKCGDAMCSIGPPGFMRRATPDSLVASGASARERRVVMVAGWHDEQRLALPDRAGGLVPSDTWGVVIPDPDLGELNDDADFRDHWVLVARAAMSTDAYRSKLGFEETTAQALNEVWACVGRCTGAESLDCTAADEHSEDRWRTMHISAVSRDTTYHCVRRYDSGEGAQIPAAARWRWQAEDETLWFRCKYGCCDVTE